MGKLKCNVQKLLSNEGVVMALKFAVWFFVLICFLYGFEWLERHEYLESMRGALGLF